MTLNTCLDIFTEITKQRIMQKHRSLSDAEFKEQFLSCALNPAVFSHEAHLRLAWLTIEQYGLDKAEQEVEQQLLNFVEFVGAKDKYHKTLTLAAMKIVNHFMQKSGSDNFTDFIQEFPQLNKNFKELIASHYSVDIFKSEKAKRAFLEPDLLPFD